MANTDFPFGFTPIGTTDGSSWMAKIRKVAFSASYATKSYVGDMVSLTGELTDDGLYQYVENTGLGVDKPMIGAIVAFDAISAVDNVENLGTPPYKAASTFRIASVAFGSQVIYIAQTTNGTPGTSISGRNAALSNVGGNDPTGISGMGINIASIVDDTDNQIRIEKLWGKENNVLDTYAILTCWINENQDAPGTGVSP